MILGEGVSEEEAREKRYAFLYHVANKYQGEICTAHHLDDLLESVVINLIRGTFWRGLAPFGNSKIRRPLVDLKINKTDILRYAGENHLCFRQDPTNYQDDYLRNRVRESLKSLKKEKKVAVLELAEKQKILREEIEKNLVNLLEIILLKNSQGEIFFGRDYFNLSENFRNVYGNTLFNLRWNHLFNDKIFSNLSLIFSDYYYGFNFDYVGFEWTSGIKNLNFKYDFKHYLTDKIKLSYGLQGLYYTFSPGKLEPTSSTSTIRQKILDNKYAFENGFYIDAEQSITSSLNISYGLRLSTFYHLGKRNVNTYANDEAVVFNKQRQIYQKGTPNGVKYYGSGKIIDVYSNLEPRFTISYALNDNKSIKGSYARTSQYLHLISNTASPTPLDVWAPSDKYLKPQISDQFAIGYATNFVRDKYSFEVEAYYKEVKNRLDYIDGADLIANEAIEQVLLNGQSRAYGLEFLLRKNTGKLTGWIAYTLSKSQQQTAGRTNEEIGINNGDWYNTPYDKPHDISVTATYSFSPKWTFGAVFNLQTGLPANYPVARYNYMGMTIPNYSKRNEYRLPLYHRLDVSATYTPQNNKRWKSEWTFGIYNVYNHKNAVSVSFRENADTHKNEAVKLSIFGIVPSVTYNFSF